MPGSSAACAAASSPPATRRGRTRRPRTCPRPPAFRPRALTADDWRTGSSAICPSRALLPASERELVFDVGRCTGVRAVPGAGAGRGHAERRVRAREPPTGPALRQARADPRRAEDAMADDELEPARARRAAGELRRRRRQFGRSLHIRTLDTGSCAVCEQEIRLLAAPHYDLHRLGFFFTPAPRHADLLMVTGPMVRAMDIAALQDLRRDPRPEGRGRCRRVRARRRLPGGRFTHGAVERAAAGRRVDPRLPAEPAGAAAGAAGRRGPARREGRGPVASIADAGARLMTPLAAAAIVAAGAWLAAALVGLAAGPAAGSGCRRAALSGLGGAAAAAAGGGIAAGRRQAPGWSSARRAGAGRRRCSSRGPPLAGVVRRAARHHRGRDRAVRAALPPARSAAPPLYLMVYNLALLA